MQVDQPSKLMQLYQMQNLSNSNSTTSSNGSNPMFSMLLEEMMKNASVSTSDSNNHTTTVSGLDSLTVDPQKLSRMMQISPMENMLSSSSSTDIGSVSGDDDSDVGTESIPTKSNDMSQLFDYVLQSMNENEGADSASLNNSSNMSLLNQSDK